MAYEPREGSGAMFQNQHKEEGDSRPDLRGDILINGTLYEIAGWWKNPNPDKGEFLSLSAKPKQDRPQGHGNAGAGRPQGGTGRHQGGNGRPTR